MSTITLAKSANEVRTHNARILEDLRTTEKDAEIAALRAQIEALRSAPARGLTLKVSEKGALCLYGMGRWPVTLYASQWERLLDHAPAIRAALAANAHLLARKEG